MNWNKKLCLIARKQFKRESNARRILLRGSTHLQGVLPSQKNYLPLQGLVRRSMHGRFFGKHGAAASAGRFLRGPRNFGTARTATETLLLRTTNGADFLKLICGRREPVSLFRDT
ncbi:unnamed protein product [Haemonchus placei]|uniref:Uncharacterized protein n=1 Tax=Haemonchus placei TaxID=6290 RepID=A0A0N4XAI2_HAEPC|nr:unnamed protein product [Haemonchus placei]